MNLIEEMANLELLKNEWNSFFLENEKNNYNARHIIRESWVRCKKMGVKYDVTRNNKDLKEPNKLQNMDENLKLLINVTKPYMEELLKIIGKNNYLISLIDKEGNIKEVIGNVNLINLKMKISNASENEIGTNAIGTCLYIDKPIITIAAEHYYEKFHNLIASSAPIHDENRSLLGCINILSNLNKLNIDPINITVTATNAAYTIEKLYVMEKKYSNKKNKIIQSMADNTMKNCNELYNFNDIVGESKEIKRAINLAKIASQNRSNVLLLGETGTGKELFAQSIHNNSFRKNKPFIAINCGAIPRNLVESELFGYEGGSFTGSKMEGKPGKFELADGGTIFLDEIGEMPLETQIALLRILQNREIYRIGSKKGKKVDVRIIAATNKDLISEVKNNHFRKDLFYRLNVFNINIPSLSERKDDIPILTKYFINKFNSLYGVNIINVTEQVLEIFMQYEWQGNVRELENIVERAIYITDGNHISVCDLPETLITGNSFKKDKVNDRPKLLRTKEYNTIIEMLKMTKGNIKESSENLGIGRTTLYRKIYKYGIDIEKYR